jgi:hypothetical protein
MNRSQANSVFSADVTSITSRSYRLIVDEPRQSWRDEVMNRLDKLVKLESGWDGYQGLPVSLENAVFTLRMLDAACGGNVRAPQIVPGATGDLQIEWHTLKGDIELHVEAPNNVHAWRATGNDGVVEQELELTNDFSIVAKWIEDLMESSIVAESAAA